MIKIHIARQRQMLGEFSPEEVVEGLRTEKFLPTDLAWREPMNVWKPLGEFDDLPEQEKEIIAPPLPVVGELLAAQESQPEPAWERRTELGMFPALMESIRQTYLTPSATFRALPPAGGFTGPLWFYVLLSTLSSWAAIGYQMAAGIVGPKNMPEGLEISHSMWIASQIGSLVIFPLLTLGVAYVGSALLHGLLLTLGGAKNGYEATFRAFCYAVGAASVMQFLPLCGGPIYLGVAITFLCIALREVHAMDALRATAGVVLGAIVGFGLLFGFYTVLISAAVAVK